MSEGKYTKEELKIIQAINKSRTEERTILRQIADALSQGGEATKKIKKNHSDIADKLSAQARLLKEGTKEHRTYLNISERLSVLGRLQVEYSNKGLGTLTKSVDIHKRIHEMNNRIRLLQIKQKNINDKTHAGYIKDKAARKEINLEINKGLLSSKDMLKTYNLQADAAETLEGRSNIFLNSFGKVGDVFRSIPIISGLAGPFDEAQKGAQEAAEEVTLFNKGLLDDTAYTKENMEKMYGQFGDGAKVISKKKGSEGEELHGSAAKEALAAGTAELTGVNDVTASIAGGFQKMIPSFLKMVGAFAIGALFEADKNVTSLQKNLGMSKGEARQLNAELNSTVMQSGDLRVNLASIHQALSALNDAYGTAYTFNQETLATSAKLLDSKLLDGQATANLGTLARAHGMEVKDALQAQEDAVNATNKETGIRVNLKQVLQESNKISGQIRAQLAANPEAIAAAVTKAKALGMELEKVAAAGKQLLDFESSIENELTAELMLGKQLNLEKARLAALTGDYETLTEEINANVGDFGEFSKMNVLQQEALAASVGMTADGLADQLMKKADLNKLAEEALARGDEQQAADLMALSTQEKFEKAVLKVKDAFVSVMSVLEPILTVIGFIADNILYLIPLVATLTTMFLYMNRKAIAGAIAESYKAAMKSFGSIPYVGWALGLAAGAASVGMIIAATKKADSAGDVMSPADGRTQISTKEGGLFELSKNDDVAAGPGILDKLNGKGGSGGSIKINLEPITNAIDSLTAIAAGKLDILIKTIKENTEGDKLSSTKNNPESLIDTINNLSQISASKFDEVIKLMKIQIITSGPLGILGLGASMIFDKFKGPKTDEEQEESSSGILSALSPLKDKIEQKEPTTTEIIPEVKETKTEILDDTLTPGSQGVLAMLETKLDTIATQLKERQTINLKINSKIKHDAFSDNNQMSVNGKPQQAAMNDTSFL